MMKIDILELNKFLAKDRTFAKKKNTAGYADDYSESVFIKSYVDESINERIHRIEKCIMDLEHKFPKIRYCIGTIIGSNIGCTTIRVVQAEKEIGILRIYYMCQEKYIFENNNFKYEVVFEDLFDGKLEKPFRSFIERR